MTGCGRLTFIVQSTHGYPKNTVSLQKPDIIVHFSNFILLHFHNLHTQMCVLAKFQPCILKAFEVTALQSHTTERSICTVLSKRKINYRCLLKWM